MTTDDIGVGTDAQDRPTTTIPDGGPPRRRTLFGHPIGLVNVVALETWERFSFYGMQSMLAIYLYFTLDQGGLGFTTSVALSVTGAYLGSVYFSSILGAWLADRVLGPERVLFTSAVVVMVGHVALALVPGVAGLAIGCVCIALGAGGVKANSSAILGEMYPDNDPRKDAGFSIFYAGITFGSIVGPLITGLLQTDVGFHWGFGAAAVGMAIGLVYYATGRKNMPQASRTVRNPLARSRYPMVAGVLIAIAVVVALAFSTGLVNGGNLSDVVAVLVAIATVGYFAVMLSSKRVTRPERSRVWAFILVWIGALASFTLIPAALPVYADKVTDRSIGAFEVPIPWVTSAVSFCEFIISIVLAALWSRGRLTMSPAVKLPIGLALQAVAIFVGFVPYAAAEPGTVPVVSLVPYFILIGISQFLLYPMALSAATKLAPKAFYAQMVAVVYLAVSLGYSLAGVISSHGFHVDDRGGFFVVLAIASAVLAVIYVALQPVLRRLMVGIK